VNEKKIKPTVEMTLVYDVEDGCYHESETSIKRRIAKTFGFKEELVIALEGDEQMVGHVSVCTGCRFEVCGIGYFTDFETIEFLY
jgi:hypothetical protein